MLSWDMQQNSAERIQKQRLTGCNCRWKHGRNMTPASLICQKTHSTHPTFNFLFCSFTLLSGWGASQFLPAAQFFSTAIFYYWSCGPLCLHEPSHPSTGKWINSRGSCSIKGSVFLGGLCISTLAGTARTKSLILASLNGGNNLRRIKTIRAFSCL